MAWTIKFTIQAAKQFQALDKPIRQRIQKFLAHRLAHLDNPRTFYSAGRSESSAFGIQINLIASQNSAQECLSEDALNPAVGAFQ